MKQSLTRESDTGGTRILLPAALLLSVLPMTQSAAQSDDARYATRSIYYAGTPYAITMRTDQVAVRYATGLSEVDRGEARGRQPLLARATPLLPFPSDDLNLYALAASASAVEIFDQTASMMNDPGIEYATPVYEAKGAMMVPTSEIFVQLKGGVQETLIDDLMQQYGLDLVRKISWREGNYMLKTRPRGSLDPIAVCEELSRRPDLEFAEPNFLVQIDRADTTNDPLFDEQWNLGRGRGGPDFDIDAPEGWEIQQGRSNVYIAVLDFGFDTNHPDYKQSIIYKKSFAPYLPDSAVNPVAPWEGHGTACAGIAAAISDNHTGIAGVAGGASIVPVRIGVDIGPPVGILATTGGISQAISWARQDAAADVLSNSWGGIPVPSNEIHAAIRDAVVDGRYGKGAVVVFAAGNDSTGQLTWPASVPEVISVGATDQSDHRAVFSQYGSGLVCSAPGVNIVTTDVQGSWGYAAPGQADSVQADHGNYFKRFGGTSAACPQVAGLAALLLSQYPQYTAQEIQARIEQTCDRVGGYNYDSVTGVSSELGYGRINLYRALSGKPQVETGPPGPEPSMYEDHADLPDYGTAWHHNAAYECLGYDYSPEAHEVDPIDPDGRENYQSDHGADGFDEGEFFYPPYIPGELARVEVVVSVENSDSRRYQQADLYLSVWFDWESDDVFDNQSDWVVRNKVVKPSQWGGATSNLVPISFIVPSDAIGWHIQNEFPSRFLNVRTRLSYADSLTSAYGFTEFGEVEDCRILNFVEMFDRELGYMWPDQNCPVWIAVNDTEPWTCHPAFKRDRPPNGYATAESYFPLYQGDGGATLWTPVFDLRELTEAYLRFQYSGVEMARGRVLVQATLPNGTTSLDTLWTYDFGLPQAPCAPVYDALLDLTSWCGDGFDNVEIGFQTFWNDPCGIALPNYQDWKIDNVCVWGIDRIAPGDVVATQTPVGPNNTILTWDAPGDDGPDRQAELYNVRYGPYPIDLTNWRHALWVSPDMSPPLPIPEPPGTSQTMNIVRLSSGMHHFCVRTIDEVTNMADPFDAGANHPPVITTPGAWVAKEDETIDFRVTATDPDFDRMILLASGMPSRAIFTDNGDGTADFHWDTALGDRGSYDVVFTARDWNGLVTQATTTIIIQPADQPGGSCCLAGGCCRLLSAADCASEGGQYGGASTDCGPNPCGTAPDWSNHDSGQFLLTVTDQGTLGFMDAAHSAGSGFVYPRPSGTNHLYIGGLWVGQGPDRVLNRDYDADPAREWDVAACPDGRVQSDPQGDRQTHQVVYTDTGAGQPSGLVVDQTSWSFSAPAGDDDFGLIRYVVSNPGNSSLNNLYLGLFADFDMRGEGSDDTAGIDVNRNLAWITDPSGVYVGIRCLDPIRGGIPISNMTLIKNADYVYQNQYILDADKYAFLTAADAAHVRTDGSSPTDYGMLAALGPFSLPPGTRWEFALAIAGGQGFNELVQNTDAAQSAYTVQAADVRDGLPVVLETKLLGVAPNPFRSTVSVRFDLAEPGMSQVDIVDVSGRLVRRLYHAHQPAGSYQVRWDGSDERGNRAAGGIYFARLKTRSIEEGRRIVLLR